MSTREESQSNARFRKPIITAALLTGLAICGASCEYLMDPNLLRKSSDNTDEFQCTLSSPDEDGIFKNRSYRYTLRCVAKQGPVRFINLRASVVATERGSNDRMQSRSVAERIIRNGGVVVTPERPFEYTGSIKVGGIGTLSGNRDLHISASIDYPNDPKREYEEDEQDRINRPWRYKLLVVNKL